jgi:hypothetical protein
VIAVAFLFNTDAVSEVRRRRHDADHGRTVNPTFNWFEELKQRAPIKVRIGQDGEGRGLDLKHGRLCDRQLGD